MRPDRPARTQAILDIPFGDGAVTVDLTAVDTPAVDKLARAGDYVAWAEAVTVDHRTLSVRDATVLRAMVNQRAHPNARPRTPAAPKRRRHRR